MENRVLARTELATWPPREKQSNAEFRLMPPELSRGATPNLRPHASTARRWRHLSIDRCRLVFRGSRQRSAAGRARQGGTESLLDQVEHLAPAHMGNKLAFVTIADIAPAGVHGAIFERRLEWRIGVLLAMDEGHRAGNLAKFHEPVPVEEHHLRAEGG